MPVGSWFRTPSRSRARVSPTFVPRLEAVEDRTVPSAYLVKNLGDSGPGSLRQAVLDANANPGADAITFASNVRGTIKLTSGPLTVTDSVTVSGAGRVAVSGGGASRVLELDAGLTVALSGLTIRDGFDNNIGGGVLNNGSDLTLTDCVLTGNTVRGDANSPFGGAYGGALFSFGGTVALTRTAFTGNKADGGTAPGFLPGIAGGGYGGAGFFVAGSVQVADCTFADNAAVGGAGGAGVLGGQGIGGVFGGNAPVTISGTAFRRNTAVGGAGGGIGAGGVCQIFAPLTATDSVFEGNVARGGSNGDGTAFGGAGNAAGGAISTASDSNTFTRCTFVGNRAIGGNNNTVTGGDLVQVGVALGGAIDCQGANRLTATDCTFRDNAAVGGSGNTATGALAFAGVGLGGAILAGAGGDGSDINNGGSNLGPNVLTLLGCSLSGNTAAGGDRNTATADVAGLAGAGAGGAVANWLGGTATITGSSLVGNEAEGGDRNTPAGAGKVFADLGAGGAIFNYFGSYNSPALGQLNPSTVTVTDSLIAGNEAEGGRFGDALGGGIANLGGGARTTVSRTLIALNGAESKRGKALGGGAYSDAGSALAFDHSAVTLNEALGALGLGGGVYAAGPLARGTGTLIALNRASDGSPNVGA